MAHLLDELTSNMPNWLAQHGESRFRAAQLQSWLIEKRVDSFNEMTNIPKSLREKLGREFDIWQSKIAKSHEAADGTEKLLLELADEHRIECVLLRDGQRRTICISTQVGCAMGCVFCACRMAWSPMLWFTGTSRSRNASSAACKETAN